MRLSEIVNQIPGRLAVRVNRDVEINDVVHDSRLVGPGALLVCRVGASFDGHTFIPDALAKGAVAVIVEGVERLGQVPEGIPAVAVADSHLAQAAAAAACHGFPARRLCLIGVTGTNGKTSTCYLTDSILRAAGKPAGLMTTLEARVAPDEVAQAVRTTPEAADLQRTLARMVATGATHATIEVSSHALQLHRVDGCAFDVAVFTNLSRDHLDFHEDMDAYFQAKMRLFDGNLAGGKRLTTVTNADDPYGRRLLEIACGPVVTYAQSSAADVRAEKIELSVTQTRLAVGTPCGRFEARLALRGEFSALNALAATGAALALDVPIEAIVAGLESLPAVPGRLEPVGEQGGPLVFVDYAHTPDGLRSVLTSLRRLARRRIICVFGCGGDRDRTKRPLMGAVVAALADVPVVTSDNPRSEEPEAIIREIVAGMPGAEPMVIVDRGEAIRRALAEAQPEDVVLIAGKGHETYQIFRDRTIHFDDREVAREALRERGRL